jgi:hypothetical protein
VYKSKRFSWNACFFFAGHKRPPALQSVPCFITQHLKEHKMHKNRIHLQVAITVLLLLIAFPLVAQNADELSWTETKDKWGQLMFCQRIYKLPEVQTRLYSFDTEECDKAAELVSEVISKYSTQEQAQLKNQAEKHAYRLSRNTNEPYHAVGACRQYCGKLAAIRDKRND